MAEVIKTEEVKHAFNLGKIEVPVLFGINLTVQEGEFIALCGSSGSGKSTLLNLIGGLVKPTEGKIYCGGEDITAMDENRLSLFRRQKLGFIFQSYNLLPDLTAQENVELPLVFAEIPPAKRTEMAREALELVGLSDRMDHRPNELSGGQQQRVSIARALVNRPQLILADEPTGNLDSHTEEEVIELMLRMNREQGHTFVVVTHDQTVAKRASRVIYLKDGIIERED
ncbi:MAG: ABC transporter ATP-binding protein [Clostridia bacterium]|nr:ABC transporter ATP-binding protein [Clostridia bacterium]